MMKKDRILINFRVIKKNPNYPLFFPVRRNNGSCPSHWRRGSGSIARKGLQALEQLKLVEKDANGGRKMSSQGRRDLDRIAAQIKQSKKA